MQATIDITQIDALAELRELKVSIELVGDDEVRIICPKHKDNDPSLCLSTDKNVFICKASQCGFKGDVITLFCMLRGTTRDAETDYLCSKYPEARREKSINPETVDKYWRNLKGAPAYMRQALQDRGITEEDIRKHRIGYDGERITIPVANRYKEYVGLRRYDPKASGKDKYRNIAGYGRDRIFNEADIYEYDSLLFCGGELKTVVAARLLNTYGVGAFCYTAAEGTFNPKDLDLLRGKQVYICMDIDSAGIAASKILSRLLFPVADAVYVVRLPLDQHKYPKGDLNDYVGQAKATAEDLLQLLEHSERIDVKYGTEAKDLPLTETTLLKATSTKFVGKRVGFKAVAVAADTTPYFVPKVIGLTCDQKQKACGSCSVYGHTPDPDTGIYDIKLSPIVDGILDMVEAPKAKLPAAIKETLGIPFCKSVQFTTREYFKAQDVRIAPEISITNNDGSNTVQPGLIIDGDMELNTPYDIEAVIHPSPKNQQAVFLVSRVSEAEDSLNTFAPSKQELEALQVFQSGDSVEEIDSKLQSIYEDLEANVTRIFKRRDLHLMFDLTYHSALLLQFEDRTIPGWINSIVVGDSSQGKSEVANRLGEHYGTGERADCKNATVAGLLGGLQQIGNRWFVSWGIIPTHDRRLVVLEEVKGATTEVLGKLTDMRSRGIAEIPKIERRRAHARTRLVFISNPRSARPISSFNFGIEAIREVVGALEDIRRFDVATTLSAVDIPAEEISELMRNRPEIEHRYTHELSKRLILFAWTRQKEQIRFTPEAEAKTVSLSVDLCNTYEESFPLIDRGTARFKIARLATALALRLYSVDESGNVVVTAAHVEWVARWLDKIYSAESFGYKQLSQARQKVDETLSTSEIREKILTTKYPADFVQLLLSRQDLVLSDFMDACGIDTEVAQQLVSFFVRKRCISRRKRGYYKTSGFIDVLKTLEEELAKVSATGTAQDTL